MATYSTSCEVSQLKLQNGGLRKLRSRTVQEFGKFALAKKRPFNALDSSNEISSKRLKLDTNLLTILTNISLNGSYMKKCCVLINPVLKIPENIVSGACKKENSSTSHTYLQKENCIKQCFVKLKNLTMVYGTLPPSNGTSFHLVQKHKDCFWVLKFCSVKIFRLPKSKLNAFLPKLIVKRCNVNNYRYKIQNSSNCAYLRNKENKSKKIVGNVVVPKPILKRFNANKIKNKPIKTKIKSNGVEDKCKRIKLQNFDIPLRGFRVGVLESYMIPVKVSLEKCNVEVSNAVECLSNAIKCNKNKVPSAVSASINKNSVKESSNSLGVNQKCLTVIKNKDVTKNLSTDALVQSTKRRIESVSKQGNFTYNEQAKTKAHPTSLKIKTRSVKSKCNVKSRYVHNLNKKSVASLKKNSKEKSIEVNQECLELQKHSVSKPKSKTNNSKCTQLTQNSVTTFDTVEKSIKLKNNMKNGKKHKKQIKPGNICPLKITDNLKKQTRLQSTLKSRIFNSWAAKNVCSENTVLYSKTKAKDNAQYCKRKFCTLDPQCTGANGLKSTKICSLKFNNGFGYTESVAKEENVSSFSNKIKVQNKLKKTNNSVKAYSAIKHNNDQSRGKISSTISQVKAPNNSKPNVTVCRLRSKINTATTSVSPISCKAPLKYKQFITEKLSNSLQKTIKTNSKCEKMSKKIVYLKSNCDGREKKTPLRSGTLQKLRERDLKSKTPSNMKRISTHPWNQNQFKKSQNFKVKNYKSENNQYKVTRPRKSLDNVVKRKCFVFRNIKTFQRSRIRNSKPIAKKVNDSISLDSRNSQNSYPFRSRIQTLRSKRTESLENSQPFTFAKNSKKKSKVSNSVPVKNGSEKSNSFLIRENRSSTDKNALCSVQIKVPTAEQLETSMLPLIVSVQKLDVFEVFPQHSANSSFNGKKLENINCTVNKLFSNVSCQTQVVSNEFNFDNLSLYNNENSSSLKATQFDTDNKTDKNLNELCDNIVNHKSSLGTDEIQNFQSSSRQAILNPITLNKDKILESNLQNGNFYSLEHNFNILSNEFNNDNERNNSSTYENGCIMKVKEKVDQENGKNNSDYNELANTKDLTMFNSNKDQCYNSFNSSALHLVNGNSSSAVNFRIIEPDENKSSDKNQALIQAWLQWTELNKHKLTF